MQFRNDIQGLRAIAFFLVFVFHLNKDWLPGGFLGVDLFFVISGYLVSSIILHNIEQNKFQFVDFFIKRIKRIVPAYLFMLFVVAFASTYFYLYLDIGTIRGTLLRCLFFISNHVFAGGADYFGATMSENPLLHTWSLAIEMQFYILLPVLLYFFRKKLTFVLIALIVILSTYSTVQIYGFNHQNEMYFSLLARIPEFLVGGLMSVVFKNGIDYSRRKNTFLAFCCSIVFLGCAFFITEKSPFPGFLALVPAFAAGFLLTLKNNFISDLLAKKGLVHFGELSYSLYLFHWPIMAIIRYRFDEYAFDLKTILFISILTYAVSWVSYTFVERIFRKQKDQNFFKTLVPIALAFFVFCAFMPKIAERNKIPADFSSPGIGAKSHNHDVVEKLGDLSKNDAIILIGDSHALSLKPFLDDIGRRNHFSFHTLTRNIYPAISGIKKSEIPAEKLGQIESTDRLVATTEKLIKTNEIIIIGSIGFERLPSLSMALDSLASQLLPTQKLILISTFPTIDKNPIKLNNGIVKLNSHQFVKIENSKNKLLLQEVAKKYPNVFVYDVAKSTIFKNAPYVNDTVAYFDNLHINHFGAVKLAKDLDHDFVQFLNGVRAK